MKRRAYLRQCRNTKDYETIMNNYGHKMDNLEEMDRFLEKLDLPKLKHGRNRNYEQPNYKH